VTESPCSAAALTSTVSLLGESITLENAHNCRVKSIASRQFQADNMMVSMPNDEEESLWLLEAKAGDLAAFSKLVLKHQWSVRAFLLARLSRKHEAEDLAQETFLTAWRGLGHFDIRRPFAPWLRGIAENHLRNHLRKFRAEPIGGNEALQNLLDQHAAHESAPADESALAEAMRECVAGVDREARELLMSRYAEGRSMAEICATTGKKHSAITMKLHRLRLALAACVEGKMGQPG
jgi:RNA polymerase sigma-70 factor, ECF subfamily